jgi:hypothetical protein
MPTIEDHKKTVRRFYDELWNRWNYAVIGEILKPDVAFHGSLGVRLELLQQLSDRPPDDGVAL